MVTKISKNNRNASHSRIIWVVKNILKVSLNENVSKKP